MYIYIYACMQSEVCCHVTNKLYECKTAYKTALKVLIVQLVI